jgi:hypothetical protein
MFRRPLMLDVFRRLHLVRLMPMSIPQTTKLRRYNVSRLLLPLSAGL